MLQYYKLGQTDKVSIIKDWLGREGLQLIGTLSQDEQEACNNKKGLFDMFTRKFKPKYNETIKTLQFHKLIRQSNASVEEWMGRLRTAVVKCNYEEIDRQLREQFRHQLHDEEMLTEIIRELPNVRKILSYIIKMH